MRLSKLLKDCVDVEVVYGEKDWDREIVNLAFDSRQIHAEGLFFCLKGEKYDGHNFVNAAIKKGAVAIVTERVLPVSVPQILVKNTRKALAHISACFYGNPCENLKIIGITGTNGKTTTAHMLASIFNAHGEDVGIIGTLGVKYGNRLVPCDLTTPDPIFLHKILADMFLNGIRYVIMEVSAHALYYYKTEGICFSACIFTNLTQDHLDFFPNMSAYESAKKRLFFEENCALAVLNGDESIARKWGKEMLEMGKDKPKTVFYGMNEPADAFAVITNEDLLGTSCIMNINDEICPVRLTMAGLHNVYNALAAATCAMSLGVDVSAVIKGLNTLNGVRGRLEWVDSYEGADVFVDFAHTPDGLEKSLCTLRKHCKGKIYCVFGCGGNRDKSKRPLMGKTVAKNSDFAILTSDNPRYEDPLDIISDIEKGYRSVSVHYVIVPDRELAIEYAIEHLHENDVLLVAGKGGERYQEIMGIKYDFDDNDIITKIIQKKSICPF